MSNVTKLRTISQEEEQTRASKGIVFVLDDDAGIRSAYKRLFDIEGFLCVTFESAEAFLLRFEETAAHLSGPMCLLCDVGLPAMNGLDLQLEIYQREEIMPIIFMSGVSSEVEVVRAYKEGGYAFLLKPLNLDELLDTIESALRVSQSRRVRKQEAEDLRALVTQLTDREKSVITLVLEGLTNPQIGERLHIALRTVKVHRQHAMQKLGVTNVVELARLAERTSI